VSKKYRFAQIFTLCLLVVFFTISTFSQNKKPSFDDYPAKLYTGKIHRPTWMRIVNAGEWRDERNKLVESPSVNFAGRYHIAVHSLGTGARFYSITNLSSGRELKILDRFATTEQTPKSKNGQHYLKVLGNYANSRLLAVRYESNDPDQIAEACYERFFLLEQERLRSLKKVYRCKNE